MRAGTEKLFLSIILSSGLVACSATNGVNPNTQDGNDSQSNAQLIKGDKGDKGDRGDAGPQGPQGIQGVPGNPSMVPGPKGDRGNDGGFVGLSAAKSYDVGVENLMKGIRLEDGDYQFVTLSFDVQAYDKDQKFELIAWFQNDGKQAPTRVRLIQVPASKYDQIHHFSFGVWLRKGGVIVLKPGEEEFMKFVNNIELMSNIAN